MTAPISDPTIRKLRQVRDLEGLTAYLRDQLEWPIADWDLEDLTFEYTPAEVGLDAASAVKVNSIRRLRPLSNDAPWGIFFIDFVPGELPVTVLRKILRGVVIKKRNAGRDDRQAWEMHDLLFISALGPDGQRDINLARFNESSDRKAATLRVVEWDEADTTFHMLRTRDELERLEWHRPGETIDEWRARWESAFALQVRQVQSTAKALAAAMAVYATRIRAKVNEAMAAEGETGPLRKMYAAFREVLLHDLSKDGFADMYAQTLTYGLFAARNSRGVIVLENAKDMVPRTNPFLQELLGQFTDSAGLTESLDFDELGLDALVAMLNSVNIEAIVADWGRDKPGEDPVIHFYEDFLKAYDKKQKVKRGIFFTPRPVVSFIVRSVHELLQTEFQLPDGLASTETWGEMQQKFPELQIPAGASAETPFVQILDPAVGTGTFLVEAIDVIYRTLTEKWLKQGHRPMFDFERVWNEYVPQHLLPRIYGFELMMAPYTIAHMKVGRKLGELGYRFHSDERLRIYLTNTLEPPQDFSGQFDVMAPALAHEARAVNHVKQQLAPTVIVGNPPYSLQSANLTATQRAIVDPYRWIGSSRIVERGALQFEKVIQDDYVKFFRCCQMLTDKIGTGIVGLVTNHAFLDVPSLRGMRHSLMETFTAMQFLDLHGNTQRTSSGPDGSPDKNVFDIRQGVAISLLRRPAASVSRSTSRAGDLWGTRELKYQWLVSHQMSDATLTEQPIEGDEFRFVQSARSEEMAEFDTFIGLSELFVQYSAGVVTARDKFVIDFDARALELRLTQFRDSALPDDALLTEFGISAKKGWNVPRARRSLRASLNVTDQVRPILYRPFDRRWIFYHQAVVWGRAFPTMRHMLAIPNVGLVWTRPMSPTYEFAVLVADGLIDQCAVGNKSAGAGISYLAPLWVVGSALGSDDTSRTINFAEGSRVHLRESLALNLDDPDVAWAFFHFIYGILWSTGYKQRYQSRLRTDVPRIPFTDDLSLFTAVASVPGQRYAPCILNVTLLLRPTWNSWELTDSSPAVTSPKMKALVSMCKLN